MITTNDFLIRKEVFTQMGDSKQHNNDPWYVKSFQSDYLRIYSHRTDEAAKMEIEAITALLSMTPKRKVLDLCCGNGRHSRQLDAKGFKVTGIDLSTVLLEEARRLSSPSITYIESDVRNIRFDNEFDYVLNLFTSFGYFEQLDENVKVFRSIYRALKKAGTFLVDFLNPGHVKKHLVPYSEREVDGLHIIEKRTIDGNKVIKNIEVIEGDERRQYEERVNLFTYSEMRNMITQSGLTVDHVYGSLEREPYDENESARMIIVGHK